MPASAQQILALLPHTQCQRCGYPDCAAYAQAVYEGAAAINQCPPGGQEGVARLAAATGQPALPLNPVHGREQERSVAYIDENWCIGCTLCIKACPVDAIIGSNKFMHSIIEPLCTGCELCIPACPVDCIELEIATPGRTGWQAWSADLALQADHRYEKHSARRPYDSDILHKKHQNTLEAKLADPTLGSTITDSAVLDKKRAFIEAALAKSRNRAV